jgi:uncharacterized protein
VDAGPAVDAEPHTDQDPASASPGAGGGNGPLGPTAQGADGAPASTPVPAHPTARAPVEQAFRIVKVASVDLDLPEQFPLVSLEEVEPAHRKLAFRIGMAEGVALAHVLGGTAAARPLTHDLFAQVLQRFGIDILAVRLTGRRGSTYLAELDLLGPDGRRVLPCRPSDGICLALRRPVPAPVLVDERLLASTDDVTPRR